MTREIQLTKGYVAIVDDEDYDRVARYRWHASVNGRTVYADTDAPGTRRGRVRAKPTLRLHRLVLDARQGERIDHIDGDGLNCRRANLRRASHAQNVSNMRKHRARCASRYKGVTFSKTAGRWQARVQQRFLGRFADEEDAARAYDDGARAAFGPFAALNFPRSGERSALTGGLVP